MNWIKLEDKKPSPGSPVLVMQGACMFFAKFKNGDWTDIVFWDRSDNLPNNARKYPSYWIHFRNIPKPIDQPERLSEKTSKEDAIV